MDFLWKLGKHYAPPQMQERLASRRFFRAPNR
jgi:hypothetical protein